MSSDPHTSAAGSDPTRPDDPGAVGAPDGEMSAPADPSPPEEWQEETPAYLKPRFLLGVVVLTVLMGVLISRWGNSGNLELEGGPAAPEVEVEAVAADEAPAAGTVADCPAPGAAPDPLAAAAIRRFSDAASGSLDSSVEVSDPVTAQLEARSPSPAIERMTRLKGYGISDDAVLTCVRSFWMEGAVQLSSLDLVLVRREEDAWRVTDWARGEPEPVGRTRATSLAYFDGADACGRPDRVVSVALADQPPSDMLGAAVSELLTGSGGRAQLASTALPADVQLVSASVEGARATVELTATGEKLGSCQGKAAVEQIVATATALVRSTLPAPPPPTTEPGRRSSGSTDQPEVQVTVLVNGQPVTTLRS